MYYQGWHKTTDGEILLRYDTGKNNEERKDNFIKAVAEAEIRTNVFVILNDEGRRRVDEAKAKYLPNKQINRSVQARLF